MPYHMQHCSTHSTSTVIQNILRATNYDEFKVKVLMIGEVHYAAISGRGWSVKCTDISRNRGQWGIWHALGFFSNYRRDVGWAGVTTNTTTKQRKY